MICVEFKRGANISVASGSCEKRLRLFFSGQLALYFTRYWTGLERRVW